MKKLSLFLLSAVLLTGCSKDPISDQELTPNETSALSGKKEANTEVAFPNSKGTVTDIYYAGQKLPIMQTNGENIYQGDILLPSSEISKSPVKLVYRKGETPPAGKSVGRTSGYWPNNTVYYDIDPSLPNQSRVLDAIRHWEANTNLTFEERAGQSNYIYFTPGSGCSSYIGMVGGSQDLTLADACSTGNVIHEIGHAIGLWHEQSRVDRDKHITIHWENIQSGRDYNFQTYEESGSDGKEFTTNLDFGSIMMYSAYAFSDNGEPTITKVDGSLYYAQRDALSSGDIQGINAMYPSGGGSGSTTNSYIDGEYYTLHGLTVMYYFGDFYYKHSRYGWIRVIYSNGYWQWV